MSTVKAETINLLLNPVPLKEAKTTVNFAERVNNGHAEVIAVQKPYRSSDDQYEPYDGNPYEVLLKIAQDEGSHGHDPWSKHKGSPLKYLLEHKNNKTLKAEEFLVLLTKPDETGRLPIHTVTPQSLQEIVELANENGVTLDFHAVDSTTHETLFSKFAGFGFPELSTKILQADPSVIQQSQDCKESFFTRAALRGNEEEANLLLNAMKKEKIEFSDADQWIERAFLNKHDFENDTFLELSEELKCKVYQVANVYAHREFLLKLRECGMHKKPESPRGPTIFSYTMDTVDVEDTLHAFLLDLRKKGLLLTQEEFARENKKRYYTKDGFIDRIFGRDYIQRTIQEKKLTHIKVPAKVVVMDHLAEGQRDLYFTLSSYRGDINIVCHEVTVFPEKIQRISPEVEWINDTLSTRLKPGQRYARREEMIELLDLIEATGFYDFGRAQPNFFLGRNQAGEEGIYFIDTKSTKFSAEASRTYRELGHKENGLCNLMDPNDHNWLEEQIKQRCAAFKKNQDSLENSLKVQFEKEEPIFMENGFEHRKKPFTFAVSELAAQQILSRPGFSNTSIRHSLSLFASSKYGRSLKPAGYGTFSIGSALIGIDAILTKTNEPNTEALNSVSSDALIAIAILALAVSASLAVKGVHTYHNDRKNSFAS